MHTTPTSPKAGVWLRHLHSLTRQVNKICFAMPSADAAFTGGARGDGSA
jgi:hypothetical protein